MFGHSKNPGHAGADRVDGLNLSGLQDGLSALASGPPAGYESLCPFVARADDLNVAPSYTGVYRELSVASHSPTASGFPAGFFGLEPFGRGLERTAERSKGLRGGVGHGVPQVLTFIQCLI